MVFYLMCFTLLQPHPRDVPFLLFYLSFTQTSVKAGMRTDTFSRLQMTVSVSLVSSDDTDHGPVVSDFTDWYKSSFLDINVFKTKEMTVDLRKIPL